MTKSDKEYSVSNDSTAYSENICFIILQLWKEREIYINTDDAVTSCMLCVIPYIRKYVF